MIDSLLFTPHKLGPVTLRNRTIRSAAFESMCADNAPTDMLRDYHVSVAAGGVGMTTVAYASVTRNGLSFNRQLWMRREIVPQLRRLTDDIHRHGAAVSVQIGHCGNMSKRSVAGQMPVSASSGINIYSPTLVRALRTDEIRDIAKSFGEAVRLARESGFDAVEVHAGHGYLLSQFLSPYTNRRHDMFGGSLENRMRFMTMAVEEVMTAAGDDMAVLVKTNMRDGFRGGMDIDEGLLVARRLEQLGVHALVLSGGFVSRAPMYVMRGAMPIRTMTHYMDSPFLKWGVRAAGRMMVPEVPFRECYFLDDALEFRKALRLPLVYVGGIVSRQNVETVLNSGFEFVQMGRSLIADPEFVNHMRLHDDDPTCSSGCEHKNYCIARMYSIDMRCHKHTDDIPRRLKRELERV